MFTLCEDTGAKARDGACPVHHGDACLRVYVPMNMTVNERHTLHYRSCGCLGDSAECCDPSCPCTVPVAGREGEAHRLRGP